MKLVARLLGLEAGGEYIVVLNDEDAQDLGVRSLGRVKLSFEGRELTAIVNTARTLVPKGVLGVYDGVKEFLRLEEGAILEVTAASPPRSFQYIRRRLDGRRLAYHEIYEIVKDVVQRNLSQVEISSFVTALHNHGLDMEEATSLSLAMVETGETLKLDARLIVDKHSIGGAPGDKTTLLVVPIVAACGLTIPKTSSRAITSAAGSADRVEVLMPVELGIEEMKRVVKRTNGCMVWGGSLYLAPADDIFVRVEHPLSIDPLLLPSIMSKKKAVGAQILVIDIPTGRGTKVKTIGEANLLARDFIELGNRLSIRTQAAITYGEQPIGYAVGPALEAREALGVLMGKLSAPDLVNKAVRIAGILLEMAGFEGGQKIALETLSSGKAERKLREIIAEQGGDPDISLEDIKVGRHRFAFTSEVGGRILWIDNGRLVEVARLSGAPKDKGAGILLEKKLGDPVKPGDTLFTIFADNLEKLMAAKEAVAEGSFIAVGESMEMLIQEVRELPEVRRAFILER
ncbi:AMP phosphorylase [Candidatus Bathyarchaeota archaeon]|nr:AMP phosphorylase [Candidatus Bathyarchaeota archaeon]MBS7627293.1 AMP phosphorylase [Candidatus Bathyarchaeota archaeon]